MFKNFFFNKAFVNILLIKLFISFLLISPFVLGYCFMNTSIRKKRIMKQESKDVPEKDIEQQGDKSEKTNEKSENKKDV